MPDYRRAHVPRGTYFFTVNTFGAKLFPPMPMCARPGGKRSVAASELEKATSNHSTALTSPNELARIRALRALVERGKPQGEAGWVSWREAA